MSPVRPVLRYPGAKNRVGPWIVSHLPPHQVYIEPFGGSFAVLLNKSRSKVELVNDLDGRVVNLFQVIRDQPEALAAAVALTPWAKDEFEASETESGPADPIEQARRFLVRAWQAVGSHLDVPVSGATWQFRRSVGKGTPEIASWRQLPERVLAVAQRLQGVQIDGRPAMKVIASAARTQQPEATLLYCDPPYLPSARTCAFYQHEMTEEQHEALLLALNAYPGPVVLSGYDSPLYAARLAHWQRYARPTRSTGHSERTEVLWIK